MPLHIVIDVRRFRSFGIGTYIRNITQALSRLDHENRYTLVCPADGAGEIEGLGPNFQFLPVTQPEQGLRHNLQIPAVFQPLRASVYHIPLNSVAWLMPPPYVVTIHDMSSLLFPRTIDLRHRLHEERFRRGALRAGHIITVSNATRRDVESILRVRPERISTIYSAPDPAFTAAAGSPEQDQQVLDRYSISYPYILYAGTIRPRKNIPRLVEAFAVLRSELENHPLYHNLRLVIIGDDLARNPTVRRAVTQTRIETSVRFLGFVPLETLRVFYRHAELFAFPSLYEGFGLAPLEAMACGAPVVASNLPSLVEAVDDAAELVNPDNVFDIERGLREVLLNPERRRALAEAGRKQAGRFHWDKAAEEVLAIYHQVAKSISH